MHCAALNKGNAFPIGYNRGGWTVGADILLKELQRNSNFPSRRGGFGGFGGGFRGGFGGGGFKTGGGF